MARLDLTTGEYLVCEVCRARLAYVGPVLDENGEIVAERVLLMLPGWRQDGSLLAETPAARAHRRAGHQPWALPRRLAVRRRGRRGPAYIAPTFPDDGRLELVCDCGRGHTVSAAELRVPPIPELAVVEMVL
jgi:hypothetical protein